MWRKDLGMPRSVMTMVTWCSASGRFDQKSQLLSALRMPVPRITFDRVVEIRELERVTKKEYGSIVTHKVPVALVCVELQRESTDVSLGVRGTAFAGDG